MAEMPSQPGSCFSLPPEEEEAAHFACILAAAAGAGEHEEVRWLLSHQPPAFEGYRQEAVLAALFGAVVQGRHAATQILLQHHNPSKAAMQLPLCKVDHLHPLARDADISLLGIAYAWQQLTSCGHSQKQLCSGLGQSLIPLSSSQRRGQYMGMLQLCLEYGADASSGCSGLFQLVAADTDVAAIRLLLQHGLDVNAALPDGKTLLHLMVQNLPGDPALDEARQLARSRGQWSTADYDGAARATASYQDAQRAHAARLRPAVQILLSAGADLTIHDASGKTALDICPYSAIKALMQSSPILRSAPQQVANGRGGAAQSDCSICLQRSSDTVMVPCGHLCVCQQCSAQVQQNCPICRAAVTQMVRTYAS